MFRFHGRTQSCSHVHAYTSRMVVARWLCWDLLTCSTITTLTRRRTASYRMSSFAGLHQMTSHSMPLMLKTQRCAYPDCAIPCIQLEISFLGCFQPLQCAAIGTMGGGGGGGGGIWGRRGRPRFFFIMQLAALHSIYRTTLLSLTCTKALIYRTPCCQTIFLASAV